MNSRILDYTALVVTVIGAVNWGLIGFSDLILLPFIWRYDLDFQNYLCTGRYLRVVFAQPFRKSVFLFRRYRTSLKRRSPFVCAVKKKSCRFKPLILLKTTALSYLL